MSAPEPKALDTALPSANAWLGEIGEIIGADRHHSYHALRAVLTALRDALTLEQSARLADALPLLVRGIFYEGYRPADVPLRLQKQEEFVTLVAKRFGNIGPVSPRTSTIAVFRVLRRYLPPPMIAQVWDALPQEIRVLFQAGLEDARPGAQPSAHRDTARNTADQDRTAQGRSATSDSVSRDWGAALSGQDDDPHILPDRLR